MSVSDNDFNLDLHFLPAWAQKSPDHQKFAHHPGAGAPLADRSSKGFKNRNRGPERNQGSRGFPRNQQEGGRRSPGRTPRFEERPPPRESVPLPEIEVTLMPDEKGVESISKQIKLSGRAYPLFDIAQMILQKPERQQVKLSVVKKPEGQVTESLFVCALDDTLWISEEEAVHHVLSKHFDTFYAMEKTAAEPPKGTYTFVAQCGMSGAILGPPNYHDYQNALRKLHAERFSRVPFDVFKSRVKIVKDEAIVKKWIEDQSWKHEFVCLNVPEPKKLATREEVEKHFVETHKPNIIKQVESHVLTGHQSREQKSPVIQRLIRKEWDEQRRFPLKVVTILSQQFATRGLQFFKVNKTVTHVAVARPHYLDLETTPVSERVKKIVEFINAHPKCRHRDLISALAPSPAKPAPAEGAEAKPEPAPESSELTPEQTALVADLHWLVHEGHVIEFASGVLETAKKPIPRPPKPVRTPAKSDENVAANSPADPDAVSPELANAEASSENPHPDEASNGEHLDANSPVIAEQAEENSHTPSAPTPAV